MALPVKRKAPVSLGFLMEAKTPHRIRAYKNRCHECGVEFYPHRRAQKFCSFRCGVIGRTGITARSTRDKYNTQCRECGMPMYRKPHLLRKAKNVFCGMACLSAFKVRRYAGENNPNYKAVPMRRCEACAKPYRSYDKGRRFCGVACVKAAAANMAVRRRQIGSDCEKACRKLLIAKGFLVVRSQDSRGPYDLVAMDSSTMLLIQVKYAKRLRSRCGTTEERRKLRDAVAPPGARKQLWVFVNETGSWYVSEFGEKEVYFSDYEDACCPA